MDGKTYLKHGKVCGGCCCRISMLLTDAETELLKQFERGRSPGHVPQAAVSAMRGLEAKKLIEPIREEDRTRGPGDMVLTARGRAALKLMKDQK